MNSLLDPNSNSSKLREQVKTALRAHFRPEFLNRVDELTIFEPLKKTELRQIVTIQIKHIERMLADQKIKIHLSSAAQDYLADVGYDPIYGVRPLKRAIKRELQNPIANKILETTFTAGDTIFVDCTDSMQEPLRDRVLTFGKNSFKAKNVTPAIIPQVVIG